MAEFIVMPKLGFDMREGVLVTWLKQEGDSIEKGEVVAEIESDKATLELEAQVSGVLLARLEEEGAVVPIGAHLAIVGEPGEDISALLAEHKSSDEQAEGAAPTPAKPASAEPAPASVSEAAPAATVTETAVSAEYPGGVKATPVARRIAREHNVDLRLVHGSGPEGRIRKADVEAYLAAPTPVAAPISAVPAGPETTEIPTSRLRQAIARRMTESKTAVPHFYVTTEIDMAPALALRKQINTLLPENQKVTVNDMIVKAAALALRDFPNINSSFAGDKIIRHNRINIGSAVAVEGGLLTIVQKNTDITPLAQVAADNRAMIERARSGKILPEDVTGSTFTVSNLGAFDVDHFIAIINPPEAAILAVGTAQQVPVVVNGELTIGVRMKATISADHRVTDGAEAARFLQAFKAILEQPLKLLL
ncbi:MAG: 2-oxo acid dehydrogenase subunit E2 [Chloroflexi bacterium]|nr:MAG: 2-oxo acid dehydrogenase subunit E2 [Chloroflexota bacterium]